MYDANCVNIQWPFVWTTLSLTVSVVMFVFPDALTKPRSPVNEVTGFLVVSMVAAPDVMRAMDFWSCADAVLAASARRAKTAFRMFTVRSVRECWVRFEN